MEEILICPVCKMSLVKKANSFVCGKGHCYDVSKEGYVNLLLCGLKNSKEPGDNKEMMLARRSFLNSGAYLPLLNKISEIIKNIIIPGSSILEAGCGEGYYISGIQNMLPDYKCYGFDISKDAVKLAQKRNKDVGFFVASSYNPPVKAGSAGGIVVVFAPFVEETFYNMLENNGIVIVVKPRSQHLLQLKNIFYSDIKQSKQSSYNLFKVAKSYYVTFSFSPSSEDLVNLFKMTPFYHQVGVNVREEFVNNPPKTNIKADFLIEVLKK